MYGKGDSVTKNVDMHIHTTYSDGVWSVSQVVEKAKTVGLRAISITDHDTVDAYEEAYDLAKVYGIELIPGVELSTEINGRDVHILGYNIDTSYYPLRKKLQEMKEARLDRAEQIVKNLNKQGIDLRFDTVLNIAGKGAIGRPHIALAMVNEEFVFSFKEAFDRYIGYDSPAYVEKLKLSPKEGFKLIKESGGIPILAHPGVTKVDEMISGFVADGLMGIEVIYKEHSMALRRHYRDFCRKRGLVFTGGSDFHGHAQAKVEIGIPRVPYSVVEKLNMLKEQFITNGVKL